MIPQFEQTARERPHDTFFYFAEDDGTCQPYTYEQTRIYAAYLGARLRDLGASRGAYAVVDMQNCPEFVFASLAAAYGGFSLVLLNHRLTDEEKEERIADLNMIGGIDASLMLTEERVRELIAPVTASGLDPAGVAPTQVEGPRRAMPWNRKRKQQNARERDRRTPGISASGAAFDRELTVNEAIHFAESSRPRFSLKERALALFTSGTTGRPKAVSLTWDNLCGAAEASNSALSSYGSGVWQAVLPLYHIGGFEIIVRCVLNDTPFALYRRFDARRLLDDARALRATHVSVVDKMLQDMLAANEGFASGIAAGATGGGAAGCFPDDDSAEDYSEAEPPLQAYECILLGGAAANPATLKRAIAARARVYASYGMTETSSQIASHLVSKRFDGGLNLLSGYEVRIVNSDDEGVGQMAVRGPGVFSGYLNARIPLTADGFFLTGDSASFKNRKLIVRERSEDMFISGGENVYPREIEVKLLRVPGVAEAYVFGVDDDAWGKRPVACIERAADVAAFNKEDDGQAAPSLSAEEALELIGLSNQGFSAYVDESIEQRLSKLYRPKHICVTDQLPRTGIGKIDRKAIRRRYEERLQVESVSLYRIKQELASPFENSKATLKSRESIIVEVRDHAGRTGIGECVAFSTAWYLPETLGVDLEVLENHLIPLVLGQVFLHPSEVAACFDECAEADMLPLAKGALEPALWDLYGKIVGKPLYRLIGGKAAADGVPAGATIGIMPLDQTVAEARACVDAGYARVKMKVRPGDDIIRVQAVREAFPDLMIMLDANQSYTETDIAALKVLDGLGVRCIEEPFDPRRQTAGSPASLFERLARLQGEVTMRVCLDESVVTAADAERALQFPELACFALKIAKFGGVQRALEFYQRARAQGKEVWMGGMYETSVSKRLHAAFETLPGIVIPGDISETERYFARDITTPPFKVEDGRIPLNGGGYSSGLGCELDLEALDAVLIEKLTYHRA